MKVLLINPPVQCSKGLNLGTENRAQVPPVGLLYLGGVLEKGGHSVDLIECSVKRYPWENLEEEIKTKRPDLIGITSTTPSFANAIKTADICKRIYPNIKIIFGGYHPTFFAKRILEEYPFVDIVCRGEGEFALLELCNGTPFESILGITYKAGNKIMENEERPIEMDLDVFPFPARHLIENYSYGEMGGLIQMANPKRFAFLITSRGCPYSCSYCCVSAFCKNRYRIRSVNNIEEEVELLKSQGRDRIYVSDDNFTVNPNVKEICDVLKNYNIQWVCLSRADANVSLFKYMADHGCRAIYFGVENFSQRVLDYYNKRMSVGQIKERITKAKEAGLDVAVSLIIGSPIETKEDVQENINALNELDIDLLELNILTLFPGTTLWKKEGLDLWDRELLVSSVHKVHSQEELERWCEQIKFAFYGRKRYILKQVFRTLTNRFDLLPINLNKAPRLYRFFRKSKSVKRNKKDYSDISQ